MVTALFLGLGLLGPWDVSHQSGSTVPSAAAAQQHTGDLDPLDELTIQCQTSWDEKPGNEATRTRLESLEQQLLAGFPWGDDVPAMLRRADALLSCRAPTAALTVLDQVIPVRGPARDEWLRMRWRAAHDAGDHHKALAELQRLGRGRLDGLTGMMLTATGHPQRRRALSQAVDHLVAVGAQTKAAALLRQTAAASPTPAKDLLRAAEMLTADDPQRMAALEEALTSAAAAGHWHLALQTLALQLADALEQGDHDTARISAQRLGALSVEAGDRHHERLALQGELALASHQPQRTYQLLRRQQELENHIGRDLDALLQRLDQAAATAGYPPAHSQHRLHLEAAERLAVRIRHPFRRRQIQEQLGAASMDAPTPLHDTWQQHLERQDAKTDDALAAADRDAAIAQAYRDNLPGVELELIRMRLHTLTAASVATGRWDRWQELGQLLVAPVANRHAADLWQNNATRPEHHWSP